MIEKEVRSVFDQTSSPKYGDVMELGRCMLINFGRLLSDNDTPELEELGQYAQINSAVDIDRLRKELPDEKLAHIVSSSFDIDYKDDEEVSAIEAKNARLIVPRGKSVKITMAGQNDNANRYGEAIFNLETGDGGAHVGKTFYLLGNTGVEGTKLRPKTDTDISLYERLVRSFSASELMSPIQEELEVTKAESFDLTYAV